MGLYKTTPPFSGRMGALWCLSGIADCAVIEYGCMGHMAYGRTFLHRMGALGGRLYSTHISETDIAMGDTGRLSRAVEHVSETESLRTVFLLPSSVPQVIGIDLEAIARELSPKFPHIRLLPLSAGGFDSCGHTGAEQTLLQLAKALPKDTGRTKHPTFNIIGCCADQFAFGPNAAEITRLVSGAFSAARLCTMTSGTSIAELERMGGAHFNLVIRREGEAAARHLQSRFGTPYLQARPYGVEGTQNWLGQIEDRFKLPADRAFIRREQQAAAGLIQPMQKVLTRFLRAHREESTLILAGHADVVPGIEEYGKHSFGFNTTRRYADCGCMAAPDMEVLTDDTKAALAADSRGFLMGSGELLRMAKRDRSLQIAIPDDLWRHAYEPPLVGFRGAVHLGAIWANEMMRKSL